MTTNTHRQRALSPVEEDPQFSIALAELENDLTDLSEPQASNLLPYIATPVSEALRQRLQQFLSLHPELDQEAAWAKLLELGLKAAEESNL